MLLALRSRSIIRRDSLLANSENSESSKMPMPESIVKHEVYTQAVSIPKFCGDSKVITIDAWLDLIDNHIINKGVVDDSLKIEVLKQHINPESGDAREVIKLGHLKDLRSYEEYKKIFRKHFKGKDELEPLRSMISIFSMTKDPNETHVGYLARVEAKTKTLISLIQGSDWKKDQETIELTQMAKLLAMGKFMTGLDKLTIERLHKDLKVTSKVGDIACHLRNYSDMTPVLDPYVMQVQTQHTQAERPSRSMSRVSENVTNRSRSISRPRRQNTVSKVECYRCHKIGHISRECRVRVVCRNCQYPGHLEQDCRNEAWCEYHHRTGHTTANCRDRRHRKRQDFQGDTGTQPQT